jgi:hypothetical protein
MSDFFSFRASMDGMGEERRVLTLQYVDMN